MNFTAFVGKQQPSALDKGEAFETRIISLDLTRETAAVKLGDKCRGGGVIDYLSLVRRDDGWKTRHKLWWT